MLLYTYEYMFYPLWTVIISRVLTVFITQSAACKSCKGGKWGNAGRKLGGKKVPIEREEG